MRKFYLLAFLIMCIFANSLFAGRTGKDYLSWFEKTYAHRGVVEFAVESTKHLLPYSDMRSLYFDGDHYWIVDSGQMHVIQLTNDLKEVKKFKTPSTSISGITFDGKSLWAGDSKTKMIYKLDLDGKVETSFRAAAAYVWGLAYDGNNLYSAHASGNEVYKYDMYGEVIQSYPLGDLRITGITYNNDYFWGCGANPGMVYKFDRNWRLIGFFRAADEYHGGITFQGEKIICADYGNDAIYKYQIIPGDAASIKSAQETIRNYYRDLLGREADPEGFKLWMDQYKAGVSLKTIREGFLSSEEFISQHSQKVFISSFSLCGKVENREPVDIVSGDLTSLKRIYFWTVVNSPNVDTFIEHVWFHDEKEAARVKLTIRYAKFRTWSSKNLMPGNWDVKALTESGEVIASRSFRVEDQ